MATFDQTLESFLDDARSAILPGQDETIDNVAWHDFAQYELLQIPVFYEPPPSGSSGSSGGGYPDIPDGYWQGCIDQCPGPDPWVICVAQGVMFQLDNPDIAVPELQEFLSTLSRTTNYLIRKRLGLSRTELFPDFAQRIKAAYETALLQRGHVSQLYEAYLSIPRLDVREQVFAGAAALWQEEPCGFLDILGGGWGYGDPIPSAVYRDVTKLSGVIQRGIAYNNSLRWPSASNELRYSIKALLSNAPRAIYDFDMFEPNTCNAGLRLVYRQEWRLVGTQRGDPVKTLPLGPRQSEKISTKTTRRSRVQRTAESLRSVESSTEMTDTAKDSTDVVNETTETSGWKAEAGGSVGFGGMGINASGGMNEEVSNKVGSTNSYLSESVQKTANKIRMESKMVVSSEGETTFELSSATEISNPNDEIAITYVYSTLQRQYEVFTHLNEVNTVIFVAEHMPVEAELEQWVKDNDWIIARVLLDDSFRDALSAINQDLAQPTFDEPLALSFKTALDNITLAGGTLDKIAIHADSLKVQQADFSQEIQRSVQQVYKERDERSRSANLLEQKRLRLLEHVRRNILHYCRAVWAQEDADQRQLRYQKSGLSIPTVWEFVDSTDTLIDFATLAADPALVFDGQFTPVAESERPIADVINPAGPIGYHGNYAVYYARPDLRLIDANIFEALDIMRQPYLDDGDPPTFLDPARAYIESTAGLPARPFSDALKRDMIRLLPELRAEYEGRSDVGAPSPRETFFTTDANFTNDHYYDYLFRREFTRQLVLDTNNLIVDIEVGTGSTLEGFKRLHRYVDVLKAVEERNQGALESSRFEQRLTAGKLSDPEIENMTVVTGEVCCCTGEGHKNGKGDGDDDHDDDNHDDDKDDNGKDWD
jgi:hypothetical protein